MFLCICLLCAAAMLPGENLVVNGRLETDQTQFPLGWLNPEHAKVGKSVFFEQSGGPGAIPCVRFANPSATPDKFTLRQIGYTLVPGAKYRISAQVRTKGFRGRGLFCIIPLGWTAEAGVPGFPPDSPWKLYERDITAPATTSPKNYNLVLYGGKYTGEISFADVRLQALDEAAAKGSKPPDTAACEKMPRFFPWAPILSRIDAADRKVSFRFAGKLPEGDSFSDYVVTLTAPDGKTSAPLAEGVNDFVLPGNLGSGRLAFDVSKRGAEKALISGSFPFMVVSRPAIDTGGHRRLNNLVTEVLSAPLSEASSFSTSRDGWVFMRVEAPEGEFPEVKVDGETAIPPGSPRREAFRELVAGAHRLSVRGAASGRIVVRQIAEILNYPPCANSPVATNPSYGWEFFSKYVMPNSTTQCGGWIPSQNYAEFKAHGGVFLDNFVSRGLNAADFCEKVLACRALSRPNCDGVTLDEHVFGEVGTFGDFVGGMRAFTARYDGGRRVYSWIVGKPLLLGQDREMFALAANSSPGGGRILSEIYCRGRATEAEARGHIDDYLIDTGRKFREIRIGIPFYPDSIAHLGIVLGNFSQIPTISTWHHPQMDMKYFLDMQFNALANDPVFDGLGATGVWGSYYCDEEMHRWTFMLTRHYCIEGRKDMLSTRYGLKFLPGHVENGDFEEGLSGWRTNGAVRVQTIKGLAENVERRWGGSKSGDTFAVLAKKGGEAARLEQTLKGFVPGRMYSLEVVCFDVKDAAAKRHRPARHPLTVTLGAGAERDESRSWTFVDRRRKEGVKGWGVRCNRHHVVFAARAGQIALALDNAAAPDGTELGVNFISVNPYCP